MVDFLEKASKKGTIKANKNWLTACSYLWQTADTLLQLADMPGGLYQIDANDGANFFEIATHLKEKLGRQHWVIEADDGTPYDQRMIDPRLDLVPIL